MRKFLFIICIFSVLSAGCSNKTETDKTARKQSAETQTTTPNNPKTDHPNLTQEQLNIAIIKVCKQGELSELRALIKQGADVNAVYTPPNTCNPKWEDGCSVSISQTPLLVACMAGHFHIVEELINAGADVNKGNSHKETPLMFAAMNGNDEIVKLLISAGADVNAADRPGRMSLRFAVEKGHTEAVKVLLAAGADVRGIKKNYVGKTALQIAQQAGNEEIVKLLKAAGAK